VRACRFGDLNGVGAYAAAAAVEKDARTGRDERD